MCEPCRDCIVECDRFEKDESIRVNFSNLYGQLVIEFLEMNPLSYRRDNKRQISDSIPHKRLIDQFVPNNILVASESRSKFHPELSELFIELGARFVKLPESLPHIIAEVVLPPVLLIAVFPAGQSSRIQLDTFLSGEGESLVQFKFVHQPSRNSIPAKLLSNQILVEVYQ